MIDLFSSQFEFFIGHKRNGRHTLYGKLLSIIIVMLSLSFLIVMTVKLGNNDLLPKIVQITETEKGKNRFEFDKSLISFFVLMDG